MFGMSISIESREALNREPARRAILSRRAAFAATLVVFALGMGTLLARKEQRPLQIAKIKPRVASSSSHKKNTTIHENCLDPNGPKPYILMSLGRSGSGSTWQMVGALTGRETPSKELTGSGTTKAEKFFEQVDAQGQWMLDYFCKMQRRYPRAGVVGFKWKPFVSTLNSPKAQAALKLIAASKDPTIKIVRSRRNLLDVSISRFKHSSSKESGKRGIKAHCFVTDKKCIEEQIQAGTNLRLPTDNLLTSLRSLTDVEDRVDRMLIDLGVSLVQVKYEDLYFGHDAEEWMKITRLLGVGPQEGLTQKDVNEMMEHAGTSNPTQRTTLENFNEVQDLLRGTEFEGLLHRRYRM